MDDAAIQELFASNYGDDGDDNDDDNVDEQTESMENLNLSFSSKNSVSSKSSSVSSNRKRPASLAKDSLKAKRSANGSKGGDGTGGSESMNEYFKNKSNIDSKKFAIQEEALKADASKKKALSNLEVMQCRHEARNMNPQYHG